MKTSATVLAVVWVVSGVGGFGLGRQARAQGALTLNEVLRSVERHPNLRAAVQDQEVAEGELQAARGAFDPIVRAGAGLDRYSLYPYRRFDVTVEQPTPLWGANLFSGYRLVEPGDQLAPYQRGIATGSTGTVRAGLSVPLWRNGPIDRRRADIQRAEIGLPVAALALQRERLDLMRLATLRYWDWVAAGQGLLIAQMLLKIAEDRDAGLAARIQAGDLPAIERTDNARAIAQRQGQVVAARRRLEQATLDLSLYLRSPDGVPLLVSEARLPPSLPEPAPLPGVEAAIATAADRRPEIQFFENRARQAEVERRWARNQQAPAVDLTVAVSRHVGEQVPWPDNRIEAGLAIDLPILARNARGRQRAAFAAAERAREQARLAGDRVSVEVRDALSALQAAAQRIDAARHEVQLARQVEEAERFRLEAGEGTILIVNLREQLHAEARVREVEALTDYQRALSLFRVAAGLDPETGEPLGS